MRPDPRTLRIAQPIQILAHDDLSQIGHRIVRANQLMSFDASLAGQSPIEALQLKR
jgi:hypothetical protein